MNFSMDEMCSGSIIQIHVEAEKAALNGLSDARLTQYRGGGQNRHLRHLPQRRHRLGLVNESTSDHRLNFTIYHFSENQQSQCLNPILSPKQTDKHLTIMAPSSAIGSEIFALIALLVISVVVLLILRHYLPLRTTPAYLLVPIFFALGLPASIVLLVPIDLASSSGTDDAGTRGIWLPDRVLLVSWRISYWLTFALTW